jgi:glutamate--cysteine ligase
MAGRLPALPGQFATIGDFADHSTTVFPDMRLKRYIETRGADSGSVPMMLAQSAFWTGLFYDPAALAAAAALIRNLSYPDLLALRAAVPITGINTTYRSGTLRDLARDAIAIAQTGLKNRARRNEQGDDETIYLNPLHDIAAGGPTQAEHWLQRYEGEWKQDVSRIFEEAKF